MSMISTINSARQKAFVTFLYALFISLAIISSALLVSVTGGDWHAVLPALINGSLLKPGRWGQTLTEAAPLLLVALGAIFTTRMNLVNIGQEGQLLIGAACAAMVATRGSGPFVMVVAIIIGGFSGGFWAAVAGVLKYWRKVPVVVSTLLMVFISTQLTGFLLTKKSLLLDPSGDRPNKTQTSAQLTSSTRLPYIHIFGNEFSLAVPISLLAAFAVLFVLKKTILGFRLSVVGSNARVAQRFGLSERTAGMLALSVGGAFAGFAGSLMFTAGAANYRYTSGFANNIGWEGLLVALVSRNQPLAAVLIALIFACLRTGSSFLASTGIQREIVDVIRSLLVLALLMPPAYLFLRENSKKNSLERHTK